MFTNKQNQVHFMSIKENLELWIKTQTKPGQPRSRPSRRLSRSSLIPNIAADNTLQSFVKSAEEWCGLRCCDHFETHSAPVALIRWVLWQYDSKRRGGSVNFQERIITSLEEKHFLDHASGVVPWWIKSLAKAFKTGRPAALSSLVVAQSYPELVSPELLTVFSKSNILWNWSKPYSVWGSICHSVVFINRVHFFRRHM